MAEAVRAGTVVLGLGNPIMADDGFGLAVLAHLERCWDLPPGVQLVDGGTWGLTLLPLIEDATHVLVLDAIDAGAEPGALVRIECDELPSAYSVRTSPHQVDLSDVLAILRLRGTMPSHMTAIGAQPARVDLDTALSPALEQVVEEAGRLAVAELEAWGHACHGRAAMRV
jgi:hydrogenase maturation protease